MAALPQPESAAPTPPLRQADDAERAGGPALPGDEPLQQPDQREGGSGKRRPRRLAARAGRITVSATSAVLAEADRLRAAGRELVDFGVGEPDFPTPGHICQAGLDALAAGFTRYTPTSGIGELRAAIAMAHARDFGSAYTAADALVTVGGKQALFNAVSVLVDHGDEVILPAPYWVSFVDQIRYAGGRPVLVTSDEERGFTLDLAAIERALTPRTKLILLNSPANPSGAVLAPELFAAIAQLCRRRGLWLLSDECYAKFVYEDRPYSVGAAAAARDRIVIAGSLSKAYVMTGWRIGYALAPPPVLAAMLKIQSHSTSNATSFAQKAAVAALTGTQAPLAAMLAEFRRRRDLIVGGLRAIAGVRCVMPRGAFYAYPNIAALLGRASGPQTTLEFSARLLEAQGVVTVPGEAFGTTEHIRLSYAVSEATIRDGLRRLAAFCGLLK
jgi:aspartate aminotransferase